MRGEIQKNKGNQRKLKGESNLVGPLLSKKIKENQRKSKKIKENQSKFKQKQRKSKNISENSKNLRKSKKIQTKSTKIEENYSTGGPHMSLLLGWTYLG